MFFFRDAGIAQGTRIDSKLVQKYSWHWNSAWKIYSRLSVGTRGSSINFEPIRLASRGQSSRRHRSSSSTSRIFKCAGVRRCWNTITWMFENTWSLKGVMSFKDWLEGRRKVGSATDAFEANLTETAGCHSQQLKSCSGVADYPFAV